MRSLLFAIIFVFCQSSIFANDIKSGSYVLSWNKLIQLRQKDKEAYIREIQIIFSKIQMNSTQSKKHAAFNLKGFTLLADAIAGETKRCMKGGFFGNLDEKSNCIIPLRFKFCGKEHSCPAGATPCNPLIYGFDTGGRSNVREMHTNVLSAQYTGRDFPNPFLKSKDSSPTFYLSYREGGKPVVLEVYNQIFCAPNTTDNEVAKYCQEKGDNFNTGRAWAPNPTLFGSAGNMEYRAGEFNFSQMLVDFKTLSNEPTCQFGPKDNSISGIENYWNNFADEANTFCHSGSLKDSEKIGCSNAQLVSLRVLGFSDAVPEGQTPERTELRRTFKKIKTTH